MFDLTVEIEKERIVSQLHSTKSYCNVRLYKPHDEDKKDKISQKKKI